MYNTKLAQSIQRDYRQAADNHRLIKETNPTADRINPLRSITMFSVIVIAINFFI